MKRYKYDDFEQAYIIKNWDDSDETGWHEFTIFYNKDDDETYCISCDQDGGEKLLWTEKGLVE